MAEYSGKEFQGKNTQVYINIANEDIGSAFVGSTNTYKMIGVFKDINPKGGEKPIEREITVGGAYVEKEPQQTDFTLDGTLIVKSTDPLFFDRLLYGGTDGNPVECNGDAKAISVFIQSNEGSNFRQVFMRNAKFTKLEDSITGEDYVSASFEISCSPTASDGTVNVKKGSSKSGEDLTA